ncbi:MAG TPA: A/G-specific adenine glycosylase [Candidatus Paceibacterota bacterium]|jgi:A/G-specific adenine glycosylase|nr:A/G-specific adenine glycosylase [Candidatus Paceibacterota bacterium]
MTLKAHNNKRFIKTVSDFYKKQGRHDLPWRKTSDPYKIAVSEIMLQQTQVSRVIEKYKEFLKAFPTARSLASAPLPQVLSIWSGLGYNRRAKFLHEMAKAVSKQKSFPKTLEDLKALPGIGAYTAGAITVFAYNDPAVFIETNIRTVYLHHFFADKKNVSDKELFPIIKATLDHKNPREWYWALMDYGSYLKSQGVVIHRTSKAYKKQPPLKGSLREVRGAILKQLVVQPRTLSQLQKILPFEKERISEAYTALKKEKLITA